MAGRPWELGRAFSKLGELHRFTRANAGTGLGAIVGRSKTFDNDTAFDAFKAVVHGMKV
jgi:hypothetical protein